MATVDCASTVGAGESRWSRGSVDNSVNFSQRASALSRDWPVWPRDSLDTEHCLVHTRQSCAPQTGASFGKLSQTSLLQFVSTWRVF
jgi:hypothetical protein